MDEKDLDDDVVEDALEDEETPRQAAPTPQPERPGFMGKVWAWQHALDRKWDGLGRGRFARVLRMARKPEPEEFRQSAIIVLVGIAIIGGIGFFMYLLMDGLIGWVDRTLAGI